MAKRYMQDIAPHGKKRTIRDIKKDDLLPYTVSREDIVSPLEENEEEEHHEPFAQSGGEGREPDQPGGLGKKIRSHIWIWVLAVLGVVLVAILSSSLFSGASVYVTPVQDVLSLDGTVTAHKKPDQGQLGFDTITVTGDVTQGIPAPLQKEVNQRASGMIMVYNAYSSSSQKLIVNTRFETPDGKIYRIHQPITVPGTTVQEGKVIPGSIAVRVYADQPGADYNIDLSDFTIPGFKGTPRYTKFYGRSKTPMTGGVSGTVNTMSADDWQKTLDGMHADLKKALLAKARAQLPAGAVLYDGTSFVTYDDPGNIPVSQTGSTASVKLSGTLDGVFFDKGALSAYLAKQNLSTYDDAPVLIAGIQNLPVTAAKSTFDPQNDTSFDFSVRGTATVVWQIDEAAIKKALIGTPKNTFNTIMGATTPPFSSIKKARADIKPFWANSFPGSPDRISIEIESTTAASGTPTGG